MRKYDPNIAPDPQKWLSLDEQERLNLVENYHKHEDLSDLSMYAIMHAIVENQIALGDELPVRRTLDRLISEGLERHDAIHALATIVCENLFDMMKTEAPFSKSDFDKRLERLSAKEWLKAS